MCHCASFSASLHRSDITVQAYLVFFVTASKMAPSSEILLSWTLNTLYVLAQVVRGSIITPKEDHLCPRQTHLIQIMPSFKCLVSSCWTQSAAACTPQLALMSVMQRVKCFFARTRTQISRRNILYFKKNLGT